MNIARLLLSDQTLTVPNVLKAAVFLALFGMAVNGLFELCKLLPPLCIDGVAAVGGWEMLFMYLLPTIVVLFWVYLDLYPKLKAFASDSPSSGKSPDVAYHRGLIVALSKPSRMTAEEITEEIIGCVFNMGCPPDGNGV